MQVYQFSAKSGFNRSVITVHTNIFAKKIASCINLQLPIVILEKSILLDMLHHKTCRYINFQQNRVNRSVITVHTNVFTRNRKLHKFATTNSNFLKLTLSDMHHRKTYMYINSTYMYINFQQNQISRSVKTVHTNLFAKKCKLHNCATCN